MRVLNNVQMRNESYFELFIAMLEQPQAGRQATGYEEMRRVVPLIEKLAAVPSAPEPAQGDFPKLCALVLEDAEWEIIKERVTADNAFTRNDAQLLTMIEHVVHAPPISVEELGAVGSNSDAA